MNFNFGDIDAMETKLEEFNLLIKEHDDTSGIDNIPDTIKQAILVARKFLMSPRPPPKISLKHEWKRELGSEHAQRPEVGQLSRSFQSNQPTLNPIRERSGRLDITHDVIGVQDERKTSRSQEIDVNSFCEEPSSSERTERPVTGPIPG